MPRTEETGPSRRRLGAGLLALAGLAAGPAVSKPSPNVGRTSLHQEVSYPGAPARVYDTLLSSKAFTALTGAAATIDPRVGGAFKLFEGQVDGVIVELVPNRRIVQAWRPIGDFAPGVYTLVRFELTPRAGGVLVTLDQTGFLPGHYDHLYSGWYAHYWTPLRRALA